MPLATVGVTAGLNNAHFTWEAVAGSKLHLELGATRSYGLSLSLKNVSGSVDIRSLAPGTTYYYRLSSDAGRTSVAGSFVTEPAGGSTTLTRSGNRLLLDGIPFLPVMAYAGACSASPGLVAGALSLGAAILDDSVVVSKASGGYFNTCSDPSTVSALAASLAGRAWYYSDNPDVRSSLVGLPGALQSGLGLERTLNASAIGRKCSPALAAAMPCYFDSMASTASIKPVVVTSVLTEGQAFPKVHNDFANFEFWEGFAAGAVGIDYYAKGPNASFSVANPGVAALAHANAAKLATLEPAILGGVRSVLRVGGAPSVRARAWTYAGATYLLAVNVSRTSASAAFTVGPRISAGKVAVLWEDRSIDARAGTLKDSFNPLGVHIYRFP